MRTILEADIGADGLKIRVMEHPDTANEFEIIVTRHGLPEFHYRSATELRLLGEAIRLAGLQQLEMEAK